MVPESRNVPRSTLRRSVKIDFAATKVPLLFLTGDQDHLTPVAMVKRNGDKYQPGSGSVDYQEVAVDARSMTHVLHEPTNDAGRVAAKGSEQRRTYAGRTESKASRRQAPRTARARSRVRHSGTPFRRLTYPQTPTLPQSTPVVMSTLRKMGAVSVKDPPIL